MTKQEIWDATHRINENDKVERCCSKCGEWMEENEDYFYLMNKKKSNKRYASECKKCRIDRTLKNHFKNREKYLAYFKECYHDDPQKYIDWDRENKKLNPELHKLNQSNWRKSHPEKCREYNKERNINKKHTIFKKEWISCKGYFGNACAYCGLPIEEHYFTRKGITKLGDLHKDHVDNNGANDLSNCVPACRSCNSSKHDALLEDWYNKNNAVFSIERESKILSWLTEDYKQYIKEKKLIKELINVI